MRLAAIKIPAYPFSASELNLSKIERIGTNEKEYLDCLFKPNPGKSFL